MIRARTAIGAFCLLLAGFGAAALLAGTSLGSGRTESTSTLTIAPVQPPSPPPLRQQHIPAGVTIGGVHVGGLEPEEAKAVVRAAFEDPLVLLVRGHRVSVSPLRLGARARIEGAVARALAAPARSAVRLVVTVRAAAVSAYTRRLVATYSRKLVDAQVVLRGLRPVLLPGHAGLAIEPRAAMRLIVKSLQANRRGPVVVPTRVLRQERTAADFGAVIVIRRGANLLYLYRGTTFWRRFAIATGQAAYPTPLGHFEIVVKWRNPWWYPPPSPWAQGLSPVPPGPGNPLGTRWMGLTAPGVGIHGTPDAASIGYSASHGCIRMLIPDAEWLFDHVQIGTPVFIVAA